MLQSRLRVFSALYHTNIPGINRHEFHSMAVLHRNYSAHIAFALTRNEVFGLRWSLAGSLSPLP